MPRLPGRAARQLTSATATRPTTRSIGRRFAFSAALFLLLIALLVA